MKTKPLNCAQLRAHFVLPALQLQDNNQSFLPKLATGVTGLISPLLFMVGLLGNSVLVHFPQFFTSLVSPITLYKQTRFFVVANFHNFYSRIIFGKLYSMKLKVGVFFLHFVGV